MHGEVEHTQFLPKSILATAPAAASQLHRRADVDGELPQRPRLAGGRRKPGQANFAAIQGWNSASVYQRAIALIGQQIDSRDGTSARR